MYSIYKYKIVIKKWKEWKYRILYNKTNNFNAVYEKLSTHEIYFKNGPLETR